MAKATLVKDAKTKLGMVKYSFLTELSKPVELDEMIGFTSLFKCELSNLDGAKKLALAELQSSTTDEFMGVAFDKDDVGWKFDGPLNKKLVYTSTFANAHAKKFRGWQFRKSVGQ